jgi:hypothetical protein
MDTENEILKHKILTLEQEIEQLKEHLKRYTAPLRSKTYYENHKEEVIQKVKSYKESTQYKYVPTAEQKKKWARTAYLKKKEKQDSIENI